MSDTGFDKIAKHLIAKGVNVNHSQSDVHYTANDIVLAIENSINNVPILSKECALEPHYQMAMGEILVVDGVEINNTFGTATSKFYVHGDGSITN